MMIRFLLNREQVALDARADLTVLEFLRERRRCGTKEGCASGDCGACTVVVASVVGGRLIYRSVNSCILFAGALHGRQLITVEDLAGDELHPVQQAMVEQHASQCGFCTPGFVMSLFALYKNESTPTRATVEDYLGGNLCRCTGYRPIVDAALAAARGVKRDRFSDNERECIKQLKVIANTKPDAPRFHLPASASEVAALLQRHPDARLLAGGTDLALEVTQQLDAIDDIVCLGGVGELRRLRSDGDGIEIGAAVTLADCADLLAAEYPDLEELLHRFGGMQVRNQASVGGNLANASPVADLPPVLLALDAKVNLQRGEHLRTLDLEKFYCGYKKTALKKNEFIRSVQLPRARRGETLTAYKISKRMDDDISAVCAVFLTRVDDGVVTAVRTGFGGMAAVPKRARRLEAALRGRALDDATLTDAARALQKDFTPINDVRASANYRITVAQNLLRRLSIELQQPSTATRVAAVVA